MEWSKIKNILIVALLLIILDLDCVSAGIVHELLDRIHEVACKVSPQLSDRSRDNMLAFIYAVVCRDLPLFFCRNVFYVYTLFGQRQTELLSDQIRHSV